MQAAKLAKAEAAAETHKAGGDAGEVSGICRSCRHLPAEVISKRRQGAETETLPHLRQIAAGEDSGAAYGGQSEGQRAWPVLACRRAAPCQQVQELQQAKKSAAEAAEAAKKASEFSSPD